MERGDSLHSSVVGITTAIYPIVGQEELENPPPLNQPFNETQRNNWTICTIFYDGRSMEDNKANPQTEYKKTRESASCPFSRNRFQGCDRGIFFAAKRDHLDQMKSVCPVLSSQLKKCAARSKG